MKKMSTEETRYREAIAALEKLSSTAHGKMCGMCGGVAFAALLEGDTADLIMAINLLQGHVTSGSLSENTKCGLEGCIHHERLPFVLARRMLGSTGSGIDSGRDMAGRKTGSIDLEATAPEEAGILPVTEPGSILIRFTGTRASAHLMIDFSDIEPRPGEHFLQAIARGWDDYFQLTKTWCLGAYWKIRSAALQDLEDRPPRAWEKKSPIRK